MDMLQPAPKDSVAMAGRTVKDPTACGDKPMDALANSLALRPTM